MVKTRNMWLRDAVARVSGRTDKSNLQLPNCGSKNLSSRLLRPRCPLPKPPSHTTVGSPHNRPSRNSSSPTCIDSSAHAGSHTPSVTSSVSVSASDLGTNASDIQITPLLRPVDTLCPPDTASSSSVSSSQDGLYVKDSLPSRLFQTDRYPTKGRVNSYSKLQYLIDILSILEGTPELTFRMLKVGEKVRSQSHLLNKLKQHSLAIHGFPMAIQLLLFKSIPALLQYLPGADDLRTFLDKPVAVLPPLKTFHSENILQLENSRDLFVACPRGPFSIEEKVRLPVTFDGDQNVACLVTLLDSGHRWCKADWVGGDASLLENAPVRKRFAAEDCESTEIAKLKAALARISNQNAARFLAFRPQINPQNPCATVLHFPPINPAQ
ncbi:predicted protein [Arabidopsis lyrata subsp. lyrata]|uniref:Predicted protein n=1 Tax=Arabidopsis lyrata subsp. lyrata TaxID=81972 RepID=D7KF21_ARALL|nr:predicted protein [Arabidopsis lyrata subsp. lyrata]